MELPTTITILRDDRSIAVDGVDVIFAGARIDGSSRWVGVAHHDGQTLKVGSSSTTQFAICRCVDWQSMPTLPSRPDDRRTSPPVNAGE